MKTSLKPLLFFSLSCCLLVLSSCGQVDSDKSKVKITMPYLNSSQKTLGNISTKSSEYNPNTINDINCFAVMVGAPETILSRTSCEVTKTTTAVVSGSTVASSTVVGEKRVGIIRGLVPSGQTIVLDVPSGSGRTFTLVGLKAVTSNACLDFSNADLNFDLISDPYIVGESAPINLESGAEVTVPIILAASGTAFTNESRKIGECYGPDAPGKNKIIPTKFTITKNSFPNMIFKENSCNALEINYVDDLGRRAQLPSNASANISFYTSNSSGTVSGNYQTLTYYTDKTCSGAAVANGLISFDKNSNSQSKEIYISTLDSTNYANYNINLTNITGLSTPVTGSNQSFSNFNPDTITIGIAGATRLIQAECYNMKAKFVSVSGTTYTSGTVKYQVDSLLSDTIIYSGPDCVSTNIITKQSVSSTATSPSVNPSSFDFSVRMYSLPNSKSTIKLTPLLASSTAVVYPIEMTGGLKNPAQLEINMWNTFASNGYYCSDVFTASITNEKGSLVPLSTSGTLQIAVSSTVSGIYIKDQSCVTMAAPATFNIQSGEYQKRFTLYSSSVSPGAEADIIFTANVTHPITGVSTTVIKSQRIKFQ